MPALIRPLHAKIGEDWSEEYTVVDEDGLPANWTGWTGSAMIRRRVGDAADVATLTVDMTVNGTITVTLPHSETESLAPFVGFWDLLTVSPAGLRQYLVEGIVTIRGRATL